MERVTFEQAREFLRGYRDACLCADDAAQRLAEFRERNAGLKAIKLSDMPKSRGEPRDLSDYMAELDELERNLDSSITIYIRQAGRVSAVIGSVEDAEEQRVLRFRYLLGRRFDFIAHEMGYSYRQTLRIHKRAVYSVARILSTCH